MFSFLITGEGEGAVKAAASAWRCGKEETARGYMDMKSIMIRKAEYALAAAAVLIAALVIASDGAYAAAANDWPSYRGNDDNNAVVPYSTPIEQKLTEPVWVRKFGAPAKGMNNWDYAPNTPIIVDDDLVTTSGDTIMRINTDSGKTVASGRTTYAADWGYTPMTFIEEDRVGYLFCPLANGTIDAFDYDDLARGPLWTFKAGEKNADGSSRWGLTAECTVEEYKENHKGEEPPADIVTEDGTVLMKSSSHQSLSPISYSDGIIYTGFFTYPHTYYDYFVAIAARDITLEDPETGAPRDYHAGDLVWKYKSKGGFYWNGAVVIGDAVIVGTQDGVMNNDTGGVEGAPADSRVIAFNKKTGEIISELVLEEAGDVCSSIVYDRTGTGRLFWTATGGYICSCAVDPETGVMSDLIMSPLARKSKKPYTVSTPAVYRGRVYFGYRKVESGGAYGFFAACDARTLALQFEAELPSYSKSSPLITRAYEGDGKGYMYAYMAGYDIPGDVTVIKFKNDTSEGSLGTDVKVSQLFAANGYEEYGACSVIADRYGQLYYKNDSQTIFAIGKCSELKLSKPSMKLTAEKGKITATWGKVKNATGYRLLYRLNEKGSFKRVDLKKTKTKYVIKGLKNGAVAEVKMRAEHTDAAKKVNGSYTDVKTVYAAKSTIKKLSGGKGYFTIQYDKHKIADGYQVQYALKKSMSGAGSFAIKGASKTKYKKTGVTGGKTYYVRVRSYKVVNQKKVNGKWTGGTIRYGKWSSKKKVKVKAVPAPAYTPYSPYSSTTNRTGTNTGTNTTTNTNATTR